MTDWQSLDEAIALNLIRSRLRAEGKATLNVREGMPASDLLRRAFLRAYAHEELGLTKTYSYPAQQIAGGHALADFERRLPLGAQPGADQA